MRRQQARAAGRVDRLAERPPDRGGRRGAIPLGQPQQRQAGLGLAAGLARLAVGRLGRRELAAQAVDLALQVDGLAAGHAVAAGLTAPGRPLRLPSASSQAPWRHMISARCIRQRPVNATMSGCRSHHWVRAAVHSWARRGSYAAWQPRITPQ